MCDDLKIIICQTNIEIFPESQIIHLFVSPLLIYCLIW